MQKLLDRLKKDFPEVKFRKHSKSDRYIIKKGDFAAYMEKIDTEYHDKYTYTDWKEVIEKVDLEQFKQAYNFEVLNKKGKPIDWYVKRKVREVESVTKVEDLTEEQKDQQYQMAYEFLKMFEAEVKVLEKKKAKKTERKRKTTKKNER